MRETDAPYNGSSRRELFYGTGKRFYRIDKNILQNSQKYFAELIKIFRRADKAKKELMIMHFHKFISSLL